MHIAPKIAVVIPCYRVKQQILGVIDLIGPEVKQIFVVDDCCPEKSGNFVEQNVKDPRVRVLYHSKNQGVGGATVSGLKAALEHGAVIAVKVDGDGQIDPRLIPNLVFPIIKGLADYAKGNRFYSHEYLAGMPKIRLFGNSVLSFVNKVSSGYWNVMDPTNGFFAIHKAALSLLPLDKIARDYFFESDMLFRLNTIRAVVTDVPMKAFYGNEESNLRISRVIRDFPSLYLNRLFKRILYSYFLRDFNSFSIQFVLGMIFFWGGFTFGAYSWYHAGVTGTLATSGTVSLAVLPIIIGVQLLLQALAFDVENVPRTPLAVQIFMGRVES